MGLRDGCAMVLLGVKPVKRAFGEFSARPTRLAFSAGLQAKTRADGTRPTGFEPVTFGFVDRPLVLFTVGFPKLERFAGPARAGRAAFAGSREARMRPSP